MKIYHWIIVLLTLLLVGCNSATPTVTITPRATETPSATVVLPTPVQKTTPVPNADDAVRAYLDAWKADEYTNMYAMLTPLSQDAITEEDFTNWYRTVATEAALSGLDYEILSSLVRNTRSAQANYRVILHSVLVGDIQRDTVMHLSLIDSAWRVQWSDDLIIPELAGGNYLWMDRHIPARANIYDREGNIIAAYAEAVSIGIIPGQIEPGTEGALLSDLQWLTGMNPDVIAAMYENFPPGVDWYLALGEVPLEKVQRRYDVSGGYDHNGLLMYPFESRFYFDNGIASQTIGYVSLIQVDEMEQYLRQGYNRDEKVGRQGIESWGELYLGGTRGGTLYVIGPDDKVVTQLADIAAKPSQAIYTSIDSGLQLAAQTALLKFRGAVLVLERDTGRVLAMASSPGYDPNAFEPSNYNYSYQLEEIYSDYSGQPLLNRATQGQYPLGSVFKIITLAAALESGSYTAETTYDCQYTFSEVIGIPPRYDWTWEHFQEDGKTLPSGMLTLPEGLMRSCNPFFWHIGLDLFNQGLTDAVSGMARGFGLGSPTEIEGVDEQPGQIPDPGDGVEAINLAIGQGNTMVTPLQVARFVAAIGNGGTVYQPQIIERIVPPGEDAIYEFEPIIQGTLPISPETLGTIQGAMVSVVNNRRGTAYHILGSFSKNLYSIAGKTGTAESGSGKPHAWFVGYTREERDNKPDIVVVVIAENAGEGSDIAAPIFKGMVQYYFEGRRSYLLPWESSVGVLATPEPEPEPEEEEVEE